MADEGKGGKGSANSTRVLRPAAMRASRWGRLLEYGGLAAEIGLGVASRAAASASLLGLGRDHKRGSSAAPETSGSPVLPQHTIEAIVQRLSRMRGAALKLAQMLSLQESDLGGGNQETSAVVAEIIQRVQNAASYMPPSQLNEVMTRDFGSEWRTKMFREFTEVPFAAASIGQVHRAVLHDGSLAAVKVQYPGVREAIKSDLAHVSTIARATRLLPSGLFADNALRVMERELQWETDYEREAKWQTRFHRIFHGDAGRDHSAATAPSVASGAFRVPRVFSELSSRNVLTMELIEHGEALGRKLIDAAQTMDQKTRDAIGSHMMQLCMDEIYRFKCMQTDPNWANFLLCNAPGEKQPAIAVLDFGSAREYDAEFLEKYARVLEAAAENDADKVASASVDLGLLTGLESRMMRAAHVDSVLALGKAFRVSADGAYDFGRDGVVAVRDVRRLVPVMLEHRLTPPPDETYSLHRKVSGMFLLCTRLGARVRCRSMFHDALAAFRATNAAAPAPAPPQATQPSSTASSPSTSSSTSSPTSPPSL